jgi:hypothetical protein
MLKNVITHLPIEMSYSISKITFCKKKHDVLINLFRSEMHRHLDLL